MLSRPRFFGSGEVAPLESPGLSEPLVDKTITVDTLLEDYKKQENHDDHDEDDVDDACTFVYEVMYIVISIAILTACILVIIDSGDEIEVVAPLSTIVAASFGLLNSIRVVRGRFLLANARDMKASIKGLRQQAKILEEDLPILTQAANQLRAESNLMRRFENDLQAITSHQGYRVDDVVDLVIDNHMTLEKQKINLRMITVYYVAKLFFNEDVNVSLERIRVHILRLQHELNPRGVEVNSEMLEDLVTRRGIYGLLQFCSNFLFSSIDMYERGDEMEMFVLHSIFTQGSVRGARGLKPLLANIKTPEPRNAVSRRVQTDLALRLAPKQNAALPMPREIIIEPDDEMETQGLPEPLFLPLDHSPRSGKKRIKRLKCVEVYEDVNPVLVELPDAPMSLIAEFLDKTQRALLCVAMSAPASSWEKHQWKVKPHYATKTILSANNLHDSDSTDLEPWQVLDLATTSSQMTDTILGGILVCIDAVHILKKLKLTYCFKVTGSGLEVLRHSNVLEQIDLSLVGMHENPICNPQNTAMRALGPDRAVFYPQIV